MVEVVHMTSFFKLDELPEGFAPYSVAVYQPKGYKLDKIHWTDIRRDNIGGGKGEWIRPRLFVDEAEPLEAYANALWGQYSKRCREISEWLNNSGDTKVAMCCWCPYDKAAQRQIEEHDSFVCHTAVLSEFLCAEYGLPVTWDTDRKERMKKIV